MSNPVAFDNLVLDVGETPRDRKVEKLRRVGCRRRQAASAVAQDSRTPDIAARDVKSVKEDGPG
jgi:hypothetical protein